MARQLERASRCVALNTAEGMYARGHSKTAAYDTALREMRESYSALEISVRLRYLRALPPAFVDRSRRILGPSTGCRSQPELRSGQRFGSARRTRVPITWSKCATSEAEAPIAAS